MFQALKYLVFSNQGYLEQDDIWLLFGLFRSSPVADSGWKALFVSGRLLKTMVDPCPVSS